MMTPETQRTQVPAPLREMLARATPDQIARLLRDIKRAEPSDA